MEIPGLYQLKVSMSVQKPKLSDVEITCDDGRVLYARTEILQKRCPQLWHRCDRWGRYNTSTRPWHLHTRHSYKVMQALLTHMRSGDFDSGTLESDPEGLLYASIDFSLNDFKSQCSGAVYGSSAHAISLCLEAFSIVNDPQSFVFSDYYEPTLSHTDCI